MFIQTEVTPNPNSLKFLPEKEVSKIEKVSFIPTLLRYKMNPYLYRFFKFTI